MKFLRRNSLFLIVFGVAYLTAGAVFAESPPDVSPAQKKEALKTANQVGFTLIGAAAAMGATTWRLDVLDSMAQDRSSALNRSVVVYESPAIMSVDGARALHEVPAPGAAPKVSPEDWLDGILKRGSADAEVQNLVAQAKPGSRWTLSVYHPNPNSDQGFTVETNILKAGKAAGSGEALAAQDELGKVLYGAYGWPNKSLNPAWVDMEGKPLTAETLNALRSETGNKLVKITVAPNALEAEEMLEHSRSLGSARNFIGPAGAFMSLFGGVILAGDAWIALSPDSDAAPESNGRKTLEGSRTPGAVTSGGKAQKSPLSFSVPSH